MAQRFPMKIVAAGEFKNRCLALMDEVQKCREAIVITKHGRPVAQLTPVQGMDDFYDAFKGRITITGDIVGPLIPLGDWETLK
jgi:prevent-host-death family protein